MSRYSWIIFDVDDTLLDYQLASRDALQDSFVDHSLPFSDDYHQIFLEIDSGLWTLFQKGELSSQEIVVKRFEMLGEHLDFPLDPHSFSESYADGLSRNVHLIPGAIETLENLKSKFSLAAATNGFGSVQRKKFARADLNGYFDAICISDAIGHSKPSVEFFKYLHFAVGEPTLESMLIVGDSLSSDIAGGHQFGIDTCWFNRHAMKNDSGITPTYEISEIQELCDLI